MCKWQKAHDYPVCLPNRQIHHRDVQLWQPTQHFSYVPFGLLRYHHLSFWDRPPHDAEATMWCTLVTQHLLINNKNLLVLVVAVTNLNNNFTRRFILSFLLSTAQLGVLIARKNTKRKRPRCNSIKVLLWRGRRDLKPHFLLRL